MVYQSLVGLAVFVFGAWCISEKRGLFPWRIVLLGLPVQVLLALLLLKVPGTTDLFFVLNQAVLALEESTQEGTSFVFGYIGGGDPPFEVKDPEATFIFAFQALPLVLVISALSAVLFYWRIIPKIVGAFSWLLRRGFRLGGAEGLGVSANIFVGMVESPLLIRPYVAKMTRSELFALMTAGMATIAGTVMVLYASILRDVVPNVIGHILTASIISVPAAIIIAKIMIPETKKVTSAELTEPEPSQSTMDALTRGTISGIEVVLNIVGMIIVMVALVHLVNITLGLLPEVYGAPLALERILGWVMAPVVWLIGVPWNEATTAGSLLGIKTVLNELIAYMELTQLPEESLSQRSILIMSYALCGFANPGSLGIMIGGLGAVAPERRTEIVSLGLKSIVAGTMATCMTGAVVSLIHW